MKIEEFFEGCKADEVKCWLHGRFVAEHDPYFGYSSRGDETPANLVSWMLTNPEVDLRYKAMIGSALGEFVFQALRPRESMRSLVNNVFEVCASASVPETQTYFFAEIMDWSLGGFFKYEDAWGEDIVRLNVSAASRQVSVQWSEKTVTPWLHLLKRRDHVYHSGIISAFGNNFYLQAPYLGLWWEACRPDKRLRNLAVKVQIAARDLKPETIREVLYANRMLWPAELYEEATAAFRAKGVEL